ncbi:MAG TPA: type II toxin-antitoxin system RelE/ParE family toxin [Pyrinomonadaceae bacterium]|jgi:plasmid stabilization system protein ParE|nr:type II toxin-antitoxin system RelE/ParE family toxin [Pyrinomonadaceae bacterium]
MAYQVIWSPTALEDIEAIASYISRDSASYAGAVVRKVINSTRNLENFPLRRQDCARIWLESY